jgi:hypothetical protein
MSNQDFPLQQKIDYCLKSLSDSRVYIEDLREELEAEGYSEEEVQRGLQPALCFHAMIQEDLEMLAKEAVKA